MLAGEVDLACSTVSPEAVVLEAADTGHWQSLDSNLGQHPGVLSSWIARRAWLLVLEASMINDYVYFGSFAKVAIAKVEVGKRRKEAKSRVGYVIHRSSSIIAQLFFSAASIQTFLQPGRFNEACLFRLLLASGRS